MFRCSDWKSESDLVEDIAEKELREQIKYWIPGDYITVPHFRDGGSYSKSSSWFGYEMDAWKFVRFDEDTSRIVVESSSTIKVSYNPQPKPNQVLMLDIKLFCKWAGYYHNTSLNKRLLMMTN